MNLQTLINAIERLWRRIQLVVGRGKINVVADTGVVQKAQVTLSEFETRDDTPRLAEYGFNSNPQPGADAVVIFVGGDRSNGVIIATGDKRYRIPCASGEVVMHDDQGQKVHLTRAGIVLNTPKDIDISGKNVRIHATDTLKWDCGGNGPVYTPTTRTDYVIGSTGSSQNLHPPEIP